MGYIILTITATILSVIGFVEILKALVFRLYKCPTKNAVLLITPDFSQSQNPEYFLRSHGEYIKWAGKLHPDKIMCITDNMTPEGKKIAALICSEYDFMELTTTDELNKIIKQNVCKKDC